MMKNCLGYRELENRWVRTPAGLVADRRSIHPSGIKVLPSMGLREQREPAPFQQPDLAPRAWVGAYVTTLSRKLSS